MKGATRPFNRKIRRMPGARRIGAAGAPSGRGFTLIEIVVVLVIIAALAALVLPTMTRGAGYSSRDDVTDLLDAAVAEARALSAKKGSAVSIRLRDDESGGVLVVVADGAALAEEPATDADPPDTSAADELVIGRIRQSPEKPEAAEGGSAPRETSLAIVTPDGTVHPGDPAQVRVGSEGDPCKVTLDSFGGVHVGERGAGPGVTAGETQAEFDVTDAEEELPVSEEGVRPRTGW